MLTINTEDLLARLSLGTHQSEDTDALEHASASDLLRQLTARFRWTFQDRRLKHKHEIGMARSLAFELVSPAVGSALVATGMVVPVFRHCIFLVSESDSITGITLASKLILRPIRKPARGIAMRLGRGFALNRLPDGWALQPIKSRTVRLSEESLAKHGWRFDAIPRLRAIA